MVELERQILSISEREQRRLGLDLHDDLCQRLATTEYLCHALQRELGRHRRPEAKRAREIGKLLRETTSHARGVAAGLATVELQEQGLRGALKYLLRRTRRAFGISCTLRADGFQGTDLQHELHLYRIAQEAVSNALRHGRARGIHVRLATTRAGITLRIRDNGRGIRVVTGKRNGMGIRIMQHRAELMGGTLSVEPAPESGTDVIVRIDMRIIDQCQFEVSNS